MKAIADVCVIPLVKETSLSPFIAEAERIFQARGLSPRLHAYGTNVEGEWDEVMGALREVHERLHAMGVPRISSNLRIGTRVDRVQSGEDRIRSVREKMG